MWKVSKNVPGAKPKSYRSMILAMDDAMALAREAGEVVIENDVRKETFVLRHLLDGDEQELGVAA